MPFLHHYGCNAQLPGTGPYDVTVRIDPPTYQRHNPVNGARYAEPVEVHFDKVTFSNGRSPAPARNVEGQTPRRCGTTRQPETPPGPATRGGRNTARRDLGGTDRPGARGRLRRHTTVTYSRTGRDVGTPG
ncbi:iron transporter [Nucisporomicrobium flavum]|uniref:iron transporter n=1 Tax=Nucisporomicrobium flavum TaxID=2785915 RepID=UPI0018F69170